MKHVTSIHALLAAFCLAAPVASFGDDHGHYYHGRYYHGPRFFVGAAPFFWGPAVGFSFYGAPGYYYNNDGPEGPVYRGAPQERAEVSDDLNVDVQRALAHEGYYRGPIDGEIGSGSRAAIRSFQNAHGLEPTGHIDNALLRALHID